MSGLLLWCPFHLEILKAKKFLRERRTWWEPSCSEGLGNRGVPQQGGIYRTYRTPYLPPGSIPFLPFATSSNSCSWVVRVLRRSIKWVLIKQIRTTMITYNCKHKTLAQNWRAKRRAMVLSSWKEGGWYPCPVSHCTSGMMACDLGEIYCIW